MLVDAGIDAYGGVYLYKHVACKTGVGRDGAVLVYKTVVAYVYARHEDAVNVDNCGCL
jgi:hypothetical protein